MKCSLCKSEGHSKRTCPTAPAPTNEMIHPAVPPPEKKLSRNEENLIAYRKLGRELPKCVNAGCTRFVSVRHWNDGLLPSLKTECAVCATARKTGKILEGISFAKKHSCENKDGRLGFLCPCDQTRYAEYPSDCYHMDHINGNHSDNRVENIMTLCMMCHTIKGKRDGDFNGSKTTSLRFVPPAPSSTL
jgi:5-methylcytosine-specific restriction endonuclease McrA